MLSYQNTTASITTYKLSLTDNRGEHFFSSNDIIRMEAADNYTIIYLTNKERPFVVSKVLKVYEELLSPYGFVRTHRSHLVNKHYVKQIDSCCVVMQDASVVRITQRKKTSCIRKLRIA